MNEKNVFQGELSNNAMEMVINDNFELNYPCLFLPWTGVESLEEIQISSQY